MVLVLNRWPARGKLADVIRANIVKSDLPLAASTLGNRGAFATSMMSGRGVAETQRKGSALGEIAALAGDVSLLAQ